MASESVTSATTKVRSYRVFMVASFWSVLCLVCFQGIIKCCILPFAQANGFSGNESQLLILELRFDGYSSDEVYQFYENIGTLGRLSYVLFQLVDLIVFQLAYRIAMLVLVNNVASRAESIYPQFGNKFFLASRIPLYIAKVDVLEDILIIILTLMFETNAGRADQSLVKRDWFIKLVRITSTITWIKFKSLQLLGCVFVLLWTIARLGGIASRSLTRKKKE